MNTDTAAQIAADYLAENDADCGPAVKSDVVLDIAYPSNLTTVVAYLVTFTNGWNRVTVTVDLNGTCDLLE